MPYLLSIFRQTNNKDSINHYMKEADRAAALLPENSTEVMGYRETQFQILSSLGKYRESLAIQHRILKEGSLRAREVAAQTLSEVRRAMKIDYFNDIDFINEQARRFKGE